MLPEPGDPDPPGVTSQVEAMADSHFAVAGECESLAAAFESDDPVPLTLPSIRLIEETLSDAYTDELPPEVARTAMFCRIAHRRLDDAAGLDEAVAVNSERGAATPRNRAIRARSRATSGRGERCSQQAARGVAQEPGRAERARQGPAAGDRATA